MNEYQQALTRIIELEDKNAELVAALEEIRKSKYLLDTRVLAIEAIRKAKENRR